MTLRAERSKAHLRRLWKLTHGQDLIEYGLLIALISTTILVTVTQLGVKVPAMYTSTAEALPGGEEPGNGNPGNGNPGNSNPVGNPGNSNPGNGNPAGGNGK